MNKAKKMYKDFHAFDSTKRTPIELDLKGDLVYLGQAVDIAYNSDKWDKTAKTYRHDFSKNTTLLTNANGNILIIIGSKLKVKPQGIVN
jgi:hypothetical protein